MARVRAKFLRETDTCVVVLRGDIRVDEEIYVPLSQVTKMEKYPNGDIVLTIPDWLAEKEDL
jgi:hypothetical protein